MSLAEPISESAHMWQANIDNQTALWRLMGCEPVHIHGEAWLQSLSWPYKLWPESSITDLTAKDLRNAQLNLHDRTRVPVWSKTGSADTRWQADALPPSNEQILMYRSLETSGEQRDGGREARQPQAGQTVRLHTVENPSQLHAWWQICEQAFAYEIDINVIERLTQQPSLNVLLALRNDEPVGTAILFKTGQVAGVHQLGVAHTAQGQGVALAIMQQLIAMAQDEQAQWMTLQASSQGLRLYEKLGFVCQGRVINYPVCQDSAHSSAARS